MVERVGHANGQMVENIVARRIGARSIREVLNGRNQLQERAVAILKLASLPNWRAMTWDAVRSVTSFVAGELPLPYSPPVVQCVLWLGDCPATL